MLHPSVSPVCWALQTLAKVQESHFVYAIAQTLFELSDLVLAAAEDEHWLVLRVALDILEKNGIRRKRHPTKTIIDENVTRASKSKQTNIQIFLM